MQQPLDLLGRLKPDLEKRVTVLEEPALLWPELWLNVFIHGPEAGPNFYKMFARAKCFKVDTPDDADLVVFSGSGHDVNPKLYGAEKHDKTYICDELDRSNLSLIAFCLKRGIPMLGVCGGAQILHVALGGQLYQDVDNHNSAHTLWDLNKKRMIDKISSVHHQMCIGNNRMEVLGVAHKSRMRSVDNTVTETGTHSDIEAFFYREQCVIGFQGHPEYGGYAKYTQWCMEQLDHLLNENPDLCYRANDQGKNKLRITQALMDEYAANKQITTIPSEEMIIVEQTKG